MNHEQAKILIDEYSDGRLSSDTAAEVKKHIEECRECSELVSEMQNLLGLVKQLPDKISPPHDLWKDIFHQIHDLKVVQIKKEEFEQPIVEGPDEEEEKLREERAKARDKKEREEKRKEKEQKRKKKDSRAVRVYSSYELLNNRSLILGASSILVLLLFVFLIAKLLGSSSWEISATPGSFSVNNTVAAVDELNDGDIFETAGSTAVLTIPEIGRLVVGPDTRLEKLGGQSLKLLKGNITVESQNSEELLNTGLFSSKILQQDPGSNYSIKINTDNTADLQIASGKILIQSGNLKSVVIPGFTCRINGSGPEVPINLNASAELKTAFQKLSFGGDPALLNLALNEAAVSDALTLWHLFERIDGDNLDKVYVKLYSLIAPPKGVNQENILSLKQEALTSWREKIEKIN